MNLALLNSSCWPPSTTKRSGYPKCPGETIRDSLISAYVPARSCGNWENISSVVQIQPLILKINTDFRVQMYSRCLCLESAKSF